MSVRIESDWGEGGVTGVLQGYYRDVARVLQGVTEVLQGSTGVLHGCYSNVTAVQKGCYRGFTGV